MQNIDIFYYGKLTLSTFMYFCQLENCKMEKTDLHFANSAQLSFGIENYWFGDSVEGREGNESCFSEVWLLEIALN